MTANMTRRNLHIPDRLWAQLQAYAGRLSAAEERPVSTAEAMRRILEAALRVDSFKKDRPKLLENSVTHYEGCWQDRGHHNCAIARVQELEARVEQFWCPDCGIGAKADEDGRCTTCGADCGIITLAPED